MRTGGKGPMSYKDSKALEDWKEHKGATRVMVLLIYRRG